MTEREREEIRSQYQDSETPWANVAGYVPRLLDELAISERKLEEARRAIEPFVEWADSIPSTRKGQPDYVLVSTGSGQISLGDLRSAKAVFSALGGGPETTLPGAAIETVRLDWILRALDHEVTNLPLDRNGIDIAIAKEHERAAVTASMDPAQGVEPTTDALLGPATAEQLAGQFTALFRPAKDLDDTDNTEQHKRNCPANGNWDEDCTCGLTYRGTLEQLRKSEAQVERLTQELASVEADWKECSATLHSAMCDRNRFLGESVEASREIAKLTERAEKAEARIAGFMAINDHLAEILGCDPGFSQKLDAVRWMKNEIAKLTVRAEKVEADLHLRPLNPSAVFTGFLQDQVALLKGRNAKLTGERDAAKLELDKVRDDMEEWAKLDTKRLDWLEKSEGQPIYLRDYGWAGVEEIRAAIDAAIAEEPA